MDNKALEIVRNYINRLHIEECPADSDMFFPFEVYIVWKCKVLQNWKWLISSSIYDGMYYEVTYNGDKHEFYIDAYRKIENLCVPDWE